VTSAALAPVYSFALLALALHLVWSHFAPVLAGGLLAGALLAVAALTCTGVGRLLLKWFVGAHLSESERTLVGGTLGLGVLSQLMLALAAAQALRDQVAAADRVLAVTPEYNGTMPAVLNNAIDWLSRPYGQGAIKGKPFAVVGATPTPYGGKWAHDDARRSAGVAGALVVEEIQVSQSALEGDILADDDVVAKLLSAVTTLAEFDAEADAA